MSIENHPNLHCVGFMCDILDSLEKRLRGKAVSKAKEIMPLVAGAVTDFVYELEEIVDKIAEEK